MPLLTIGKADAVSINQASVDGSYIKDNNKFKFNYTTKTNKIEGGSLDSKTGVNLFTLRQLVGDFARGYLFQIDIPPVDDSSQTLTILAKSTVLPAHVLEDKSFEFQGSKYKMAGNATYDDWSVTFFADEAHKLRHKFIAWQSLIYDPIRQIPFTAGSYKKNKIRAFQLSRDGQVVTGYEFFGLYPSRVGEINLDQGNKDVETFTVAFSYDYFIINTELNEAKNTREEYDIKNENYAIYDPAKDGVNDYEDEKIDSEHSSDLLKDKAGNADQDYNGKTFLSSNPRKLLVTHDIKHPETLLKDKAGNADQDYNGRGSTQPAPLGFLASQLKKLSPINLGGDINQTDYYTWMDVVNWMPLRYSPPLSFRIRKYLGKDVNNGIDKFKIPDINPYAWTGLQKPK